MKEIGSYIQAMHGIASQNKQSHVIDALWMKGVWLWTEDIQAI